MTQDEGLRNYMYDLEAFFIENKTILNKFGKVVDIGLNDDRRGNASLQIDRSIPFDRNGNSYAEHVDLVPMTDRMNKSIPFNVVIGYDIAMQLDTIDMKKELDDMHSKLAAYFNKIGKSKMLQSINVTDEKEKTVSVIIGTSRNFSIDETEEPSMIFKIIDDMSKELYNACDKLDQVLA